jgi:hypothetical protein
MDESSNDREESAFVSGFDEFDLNSFLADNDFVYDENAASKRSGTTRQAQASATHDPNTTMSYAAVGQDYPELPLVNDTPRSSSRSSRRSRSSAVELQPASPERSRASRRKPAAAPPRQAGASRAATAAFRQASMHDTSYRVRGGGIKHTRTPIVTILLAVVVIAALAAAFYFLTNFVRAFVAEGPAEDLITLTTQETRSAIDSELPVLSDWLSSSPDDTFAAFTELGWNVFINDRFTSSNPDSTAYGKEIIHLPAGRAVETLQGYYESEFNAYDFDELQKDFNGAWMLDLTQGDMGRYGQLKYINLNSEGIEAEIQYLLFQQGLSGETTVIDQTGTDDFGNTFSVGYTVKDDETTYYWKALGIAFGDYYQGRDSRSLPDTSVFLKLTVASFDFYGAGNVTDEET